MDQLSATLSLTMMALELLQHLLCQVLAAVLKYVNMFSIFQQTVYHYPILCQ